MTVAQLIDDISIVIGIGFCGYMLWLLVGPLWSVLCSGRTSAPVAADEHALRPARQSPSQPGWTKASERAAAGRASRGRLATGAEIEPDDRVARATGSGVHSGVMTGHAFAARHRSRRARSRHHRTSSR
jgi:hypothetical protein